MATTAIDALWPGQPSPRGATWDGMGVNFALFSESAERVELCLLDAGGRNEIARLALREQTDPVFHGYLPQARPGPLHGYRVGNARADLLFERRGARPHRGVGRPAPRPAGHQAAAGRCAARISGRDALQRRCRNP